MSRDLTRENQRILQYFNDYSGDYWKTVEEIAEGVRLDTATVATIVTTSGDFVRSSYRMKMGEPLYTSRDLFRDKAPLVDKVIGAFKNRID
jgi:hypothetical protein